MNLSSLSVRRGVAFGMVYLVVVGFGLLSLSRLKLDLFPDISFPTVVVITSYSGASPEDMETLITDPIEEMVSGVARVEGVGSESRQGLSVVQVEFDWEADMDQAETDVRRALDSVERILPDDADAPVVFTMNPTLKPVMTLALSGPYPLDELRRIADDEVAPRLERLDGVASATVAGGLEREIQVQLDPERVEAHGLNPTAIAAAVYAENNQQPGGIVEQGAWEFNVLTRGQYRDVDELGQVLVGTAQTASGPQPVRLYEVADVVDGFAETRQVTEVDGQPAVTLSVRKQSGENTAQTVKAVEAELAAIEGAVSEGATLAVLTSQADHIESSIGNLGTTAAVAIVIAFLVLLVFLRDSRAAAVVSAAIPLSLLATFALMDQVDMTLNIFSTAGLALAVGMLVDNAVVVLENIVRLRRQGLSARDAAVQGATSVSSAVVASTLTTLAVFVPVLFVPGIAGILFHDMAITICFALAVSLLVALSFVPLASSRWLRTRAVTPTSPAPETGWFARFRDGYGRALRAALAHRWVVGLVLVVALAATAWAARLLQTEFVAGSDESLLEITVEAPAGSTVDQTYDRTREVLGQVEAIVPADETTHTLLEAGSPDGFAALFSGGAHEGALSVSLVDMGDRDRSQDEIERDVRDALQAVPGVELRVGPRFNPLGGEGDLQVEITGHDLDLARELGGDVRERLLALPEVSEVSFSLDDQAPQLQVEFDRAKLATLGLTASQAGAAVSTAFQGTAAGRYTEGGEDADIRVRYAPEHRLDLEEVRRLPIATPTGETVRLDTVATISEGLAPATITRQDQARTTTLTVYLADNYLDADGSEASKDLGGAITAIEGALTQVDWPEGFDHEVGGAADDFIESFTSLGWAILVAIALVYMVMAGQFESFRQPFIILFTIPLALMGVVWMLVLTGTALDVSALIGVIMLVGIVVNNGIVMVDAANRLRSDGLDRLTAIVQASLVRLRPVLMTSLTTILCMVPLALEIGAGAEQWSGMARAVVGGMVAATGLTLFVVPTIYTLFADKNASAESARETPASERAAA